MYKLKCIQYPALSLSHCFLTSLVYLFLWLSYKWVLFCFILILIVYICVPKWEFMNMPAVPMDARRGHWIP